MAHQKGTRIGGDLLGLSCPFWRLLATGRARRATQQSVYERDPFFGKNEFPQYRNISGLAGGGYGTDAQGRLSLTGPTAFSTPTAYTLGHDQAYHRHRRHQLSGRSLLRYRSPEQFGRRSRMGIRSGRSTLPSRTFSKARRSTRPSTCRPVLIPLHKNRLGASLGVQDLLGLGGSAGTALPTDRYSSQSVFFAFTYPLSTGGSTPLVSERRSGYAPLQQGLCFGQLLAGRADTDVAGIRRLSG